MNSSDLAGELPSMDTPAMTESEISTGPLGVAKFITDNFSCNAPRPPPFENKTEHIRLISIVGSHFNEKVRWGFDLLEADRSSPLYYTEDAHPPGFSSFQSLKVTNGASSRTPTIVFKKKDNQPCVMTKSGEILREFCPFLFPAEIADEVHKMQDDLGLRLGACVRCFAYYHLLDFPKYHEAVVHMCTHSTSKVESILFDKMVDKGFDDGMRKSMQITAEKGAKSKEILVQVFKDISEKLKGKEYIMDTSDKSYGFTAADLTFAALSYPFVRPPEMEEFLVDEKLLPPELNEMSTLLRSTEAGRHALRMYEKHRGGPHVTVKSGKRDCFPWKAALSIIGATGVVAVAIELTRKRI